MSRSYRSILAPVLLAAATSTTYSFIPHVSFENAPYQASWVVTGVSICACLIQTILGDPEEVSFLGGDDTIDFGTEG